MNRNDHGVVLYLKGTPGGATYLDKTGTARNVATLPNGTYTAGDVVYAEMGAVMVACVRVHFFDAASPKIHVKATAKRVDLQNTSLWGYGPLLTSRVDGPASISDPADFTVVDQVIDPADGLDQYVWLVTTNSLFTGEVKWSAKSVGAPNAADYVAVGVTA